MHVYVWEHIVSLYYRIAGWIFTKLGGIKYSCTRTIVLTFGPNRSRDGSRLGPKIGQGGSPSQKNFFLRREGYNNKSNA